MAQPERVAFLRQLSIAPVIIGAAVLCRLALACLMHVCSPGALLPPVLRHV